MPTKRNARFPPFGWTQNISNDQQTERKIKLSSDDLKGPTWEPSVNVFSFAARRRLDARSAPACVLRTTHSPHLYFPFSSDFYLTTFSKLPCLLCSCALYFPLSLRTSFITFSLCASFLLSLPFHYSVLEWLITTKFSRPVNAKHISTARPTI